MAVSSDIKRLKAEYILEDWWSISLKNLVFKNKNHRKLNLRTVFVFVTIETTLSQEQEIINKIIDILKEKDIDGIKDVRVNTVLFEFGD